MKNITILTLLLFLSISNVFGQQEKGIIGASNWLTNWTEFMPSQEEYGEPTKILSGNISEDMQLYKRDVYLLMGSVFVTNGAILTIEPGTVILGDFKSKGSLTITKGALINAKGLETDPIVFSSNKAVKRPGDWGGVIILGDAPINRFGSGSVASYYSNISPADYANTNYGGDNIEGSSGVLKHIRIEYAGKRISENIYFNGLLLASIGKETKLHDIMVSHAAEDSFEIWGGETAMSRLVSYKSKGTDFKYKYGARASLTNSLAVRSPYASNGRARCLEVHSFDRKEEFDFNKKTTFVTANNLTFLNSSENLEADIKMDLVKEAVYVGVSAQLKMNKSVISGFNPAVILDENISVNQDSLTDIEFTDMYFNNCNGNIFVENNSNNEDLENYYGNLAFFNVYSKSPNAETFIDFNNNRKPDYRLRINKIMATNNDPDLVEDE
ncbi:MAG: hypothetical protein ABJL44_00660 [Algibacter sp.]